MQFICSSKWQRIHLKDGYPYDKKTRYNEMFGHSM